MSRATPGEAQTVLGPVPPADLGLTLMHEHILCDVTPPDLAAARAQRIEITLENVHDVRYHWTRHYGNHILDDRILMAGELADFAGAGGGTVVDLTIAGIAPDPAGLAEVSRTSGVHVVAGVGAYIESFAATALARTVDALAAEWIATVERGFGETGVRPGIIGEIGVSDPWSEAERRAMAAAVLVQQETGLSITVHPGRDPASPREVVRFVVEHGGQTDRLVIGHLDRTLFDIDGVLALADTGCVLEWDFFGIESSHYPFAAVDLPNDGARLSLIRRVIDAGHGACVLISHDICTVTRLRRFGGHGYGHIPKDVVAMMRRKGFSDGEVDEILIRTPRRLLTRV